MKDELHTLQHKDLDASLNTLLADFIQFSNIPAHLATVYELLEWSRFQAIRASHPVVTSRHATPADSDQQGELKRQVKHWKANHDRRVDAARFLIERPDLPIERVDAYRKHLALLETMDAVRQGLVSLKAAMQEPTVNVEYITAAVSTLEEVVYSCRW